MTGSRHCWRSATEAQSTPLDRFLRERLGNASWNQCRKLITEGKISINGVQTTLATTLVNAGDEVLLDPTKSTRAPRRNATCNLVFIDSQLVVVDKPPGLSTVPFDETERDTLWHRVRAALAARSHQGSRTQVLVVHRIDKETSGLVVFARTNTAFRHLKQLFRIHAIERRYVALVHGTISDRTIRSRLVANRGDGRRGSTTNPRLGRESVTHVRVLERFEKATLVECRLETGRTHQIRIHLSEAGHPLVGERVYALGEKADRIASRVMLHARDLGFAHPTSGHLCRWTADPPEDMVRLISTFREAGRPPPTSPI